MTPMKKPSTAIRSLLALALLGTLALSASGCGTTSADVEHGRMLFRAKCGTCHTLAQAGTTGSIGPNLDDAFAAARAAGEGGETIEGVVLAQVESPRPGTADPSVSMPPHIVEGQDLDDVAAYVGMWAGVPGAEPPQVAGGPGAQVFANNGCGTCHTLAAAEAGGTTGPNLDEALKPGTEASAVETMIVDPNAEIYPGFKPGVMPQTFGQELSKEELESLIEFLLESTPAGGGGKSSGGGKGGGGAKGG